MKKANLMQAMKLSWILVLAVLVGFSSCKKDDEDDDTTDPVIVLDGLYVKGDACASADYSDKQMMKSTKNEVDQSDRAMLYELYIPLKGGKTFSIAKVAGSTKTIYGPDADFAVVTTLDNDEPKDEEFRRGSLIETATTFTVPEDGFYHIVADMEVMKVVVARVVWGAIGAATPDGWGTSTVMTESAFDANKMEYTLTGVELRGGDWKFRYSNGWKIIIDTAYNSGAGIKVNTNFGGALDALVPGGSNIVNDAPGVYDVKLSYTLGTGYTATATKTGDLPLTDWTGVICDAVGTGVSVDNTNAIPDPSGWGWGNKLLADGAPVKVGDIYTWTWTNITLEANEGFKLRTENGVAPPAGGANFDAGLEAVDHALSSANVDPATSGDLKVSTKGVYNIVLTIDAGNSDAKKIIITQ
ncbi:MAG: hypothetical protein JXR34_09540 [Bacteroidales bacterium]|nr:hypothetical protein [Bacteroidales bacterium]